MTTPMLDGVELPQAQRIASEDEEILAQHGVPVLEGDFLQDLGRRAVRVTLTGVLTGPESGEGLKVLREKFHAVAPVPFVSDIGTAMKVDKVLIEEMGVRELAGTTERFEYALSLREYTPPPVVTEEVPPVIPPPPVPVTATLVVEVIVEGEPGFDYSRVRLTAGGRTLANRADNVWTETDFPPGSYTVDAVTDGPDLMTGSAPAEVREGETTQVTITLRRGATVAKAFLVHFWFDNAFVEPCMLEVLAGVAAYAAGHPDEKLVIVGHCDKTGTDVYNQSLSERRARSVHAVLTLGRDRAASLAEWNLLRQTHLGGLPQTRDSWGTREYQSMLQDLGFYPGAIDGDHGPATDAGVRAFQRERGLPGTGRVEDTTWAALIESYLGRTPLNVPEDRFLANCPGEVVKWLACGEQDPVRNTLDAWRPNRRVELLFVRADRLPCQVPPPDTFNLPAPGAVNAGWCVGPGDPNRRSCFLKRTAGPGNAWLVQPAEPGTVVPRGAMRFADGTPAAGQRYVLIAPDGEDMDGEQAQGATRGRPIPGRTAADGTFAYPDKPKGVGRYVLEIREPFVISLEEDPPSSARGTVVCKRLEGSAELRVVLSPRPDITTSCEIVLLTRGGSEVTGVAEEPLAGAWVYWREGSVLVRMRTDATGRVFALNPGGDRSQAREYARRFTTHPGTQVELTFSRGAVAIPDEDLAARPDLFVPVVIPPPTEPDVQARSFSKDVGTTPGQPGPSTSQSTLPSRRAQLIKPAELTLWTLLRELPGDAYATDGLTQGAPMWRRAPGAQGESPRPVAGDIALTEDSTAPAPSATVRPKERGLLVRGTIDPAATGVSLEIRDASNNPIQLVTTPGSTSGVASLTPRMGTPPAPGDPVPFEADVFFLDAAQAFGPVDIVVSSTGGVTPPVLERFRVLLCGLQIALVDDHTANANGQQRGPVLNEGDEVLVIDFLASPQLSQPRPQPIGSISAEARARRMVPFRFATASRPLDPATPAGTGNPSVVKPQMPLWMAELQLVGLVEADLQALMAQRHFLLHGTQTAPLVTLAFDLEWNLGLSWDGPDSNSPSFAPPAVQGFPRPGQTHQFQQSFPATQHVELRFNSVGSLVDAAGTAVTVGAGGEVPGAFVPAPGAMTFPLSGRRLPQVVVRGQSRAWGRHAGASSRSSMLVELQPSIVEPAANTEILRGGDGTLALSTLRIDGARIDGGLLSTEDGFMPPPPDDPDCRWPPFRTRGLNPQRADVEALINAVVEVFFNANAAVPRVALLPLDVWQTTTRLIILHESGKVGFKHFDTSAQRVRFTQSSTLVLGYGLEGGMPIFGAPHGYGFGQLDLVFGRGPNPDEVWSFLENVRTAVRVIMDEKARVAFQRFTQGAGGTAFSALPLRRRRAMYRREVVRRYNGGREFTFEAFSGQQQWVINARSSQIQYPNEVLGTAINYGNLPTTFPDTQFGPGI